MVAADTAADKNFAGYLSAESIALSITPAGAAIVWSLAKPAGSTARSDLGSVTGLANSFTPDVAGYYVIEAVVDSTTTYILRVNVTQAAITTSLEAVRFSPKTDAGVAAPALGVAMFYSSTATPNRMRVKDSAGAVRDIDPSRRTGTFTLSGGTATVADASVTAATVVAAHLETIGGTTGRIQVTLNAGVSFVVTSDSGTDTSTYRYSLIG